MVSKDSELDNVSLADLVFEATVQIPEGMVSTYGDVAKALGDVRASRVVGMILSSNPRPIVVPCHRVVYSNGQVGWYSGKGKGAGTKTELLRKEGLDIKDGVIRDWDIPRFKDFHVRPVLREMADLQDRLAAMVRETGSPEFDKVVGLDVSYEGDRAFAAAAIINLDGGMEVRTARTQVLFPYVPTYLGFRELPAYVPLLEGLDDSLIFIDGQGRLHPRGAGIACQVGLRTGLPTIGAAKSLLTGRLLDDGAIELDGRVQGRKAVLGGRDYYISVGDGLSLDAAVALGRGFLSDPDKDVLRLAHRAAGRSRRGVMT